MMQAVHRVEHVGRDACASRRSRLWRSREVGVAVATRRLLPPAAAKFGPDGGDAVGQFGAMVIWRMHARLPEAGSAPEALSILSTMMSGTGS